MKEVILLKNGEIALKGLNRRTFEDQLIKNLRRRLSPFGAWQFAAAQSTVTAIPEQLDSAEAKELFSTLLGRLSEGTGSVETASAEFFESKLFQSACKAAIKGGRKYGIDHIKWICDRLFVKNPGGSVIRTCPHGRPVAFEIKRSSIDRQFGRLE